MTLQGPVRFLVVLVVLRLKDGLRSGDHLIVVKED